MKTQKLGERRWRFDLPHEATSFLAHPDVGLLSIRRERLANELRHSSLAPDADTKQINSVDEETDSLFLPGSVLDASSFK